MLEAIITWSLHHRFLVIALTLITALVVLALFATRPVSLSLDALPHAVNKKQETKAKWMLRFFMIDLFPENDRRFSVAWENLTLPSHLPAQ